MRICTLRSLRPRIPWGLLLSLLLLPMSPAVVQAASATEATMPDCTQSGLKPRPVAVQLTRSAALVQATLHTPPGALPATGCLVPLEFHLPEDARPPYAVWRDVETRAVRLDGTPDPAHPDPLPLRLWIHPDGNLEYEVRKAGVKATHAVLDLVVAWGVTAAANDLAVLDILGAALGLELDILKPDQELAWELGARLDGSRRVGHLDWRANHPYETDERGIHPPDVRVTWQLPSELGQLTALSQLALGGPLLTGTIPPELGRLKNLELLTLAGSRLTGSVPPELGQLTRLWILELHNNQLTALPPELGQLPLWRLDAAGNQLTTLPPEFGQLAHLEVLNLQDNQLSELPSLAGLESLNDLDLSGNRLTAPPPGLPALHFLNALDLSDNQIANLPPDSISQPIESSTQGSPKFQLVRHLLREFGIETDSPPLQKLDLSGNQLTEWPSHLSQLRLETLDLSDNQLTELPPEFGQMRPSVFLGSYFDTDTYSFDLKLNLSGNQLGTLPPKIGDLATVIHLGLGDNQLTALPPELGQLPQLDSLDLSGNQLTALPRELAQATRLSHLNLSANQLKNLPAGLDALLPQLVSLDLSGNQLTPAVDWEQVARWPRRLRQLNLSHNQLTDFHMDRSQVSNLTHLDLSHNRLTDLSPDLVQLEHLTHLDLSHNQFSEIPPVLSQLRPLLSLDLRGNPLTTCPLPLPWRIDRYIYSPPDKRYVDFNHWYLSSPTRTEYPDLPFLELCLE